jgi:hypothetical protein
MIGKLIKSQLKNKTASAKTYPGLAILSGGNMLRLRLFSVKSRSTDEESFGVEL